MAETTIPQLPQTGWTTDKQFAAALGVSAETFRDWLKAYKIPHKKLGNTVLVNAAWFYQFAPDGPDATPSPPADF